MLCPHMSFFFFFFNDTATTEIYTLSLHDALPIWLFRRRRGLAFGERRGLVGVADLLAGRALLLARGFVTAAHEARVDRKSTRLNSSHLVISYAVFCLKKKKHKSTQHTLNHHAPTS